MGRLGIVVSLHSSYHDSGTRAATHVFTQLKYSPQGIWSEGMGDEDSKDGGEPATRGVGRKNTDGGKDHRTTDEGGTINAGN